MRLLKERVEAKERLEQARSAGTEKHAEYAQVTSIALETEDLVRRLRDNRRQNHYAERLRLSMTPRP